MYKNKSIQISCDGGAATGKSTGANMIAHKYGLKFLSSGLLYRYASFLVLKYKPKNKISFLKKFNLPAIKKMKDISDNKNWKFLKSYKNYISNLKLNINLYYKFSNKIPSTYNWYLLKNNKEFIPSFTKKIFKQVSTLF